MKAGYAEDESPWELHPISIIQKYVLDTYIKYRSVKPELEEKMFLMKTKF